MSITRLYASSALDANSEMSYSFSITQKPFTQLHCHDFYEIIIVTAGSISHHINNTIQAIPCNTIIFIRPQDVHFLNGLTSNDFEFINLAFSQNTFYDLIHYLDTGFDLEYFNTVLMPPMIHITPADTSAIRKNTEKLSLFPVKDKEKKKAYFRLLIAELFFQYYHNTYEEQRFFPNWLDELLIKMNDPDNFSLGVTQLEALSGKTLAYLSRVFKEKLQTTPTDYINELRLNYCANRLIHSDAPIIDIAMDAGFNNLSHFYHLFKKKYHIAPNKYRKGKLIVL